MGLPTVEAAGLLLVTLDARRQQPAQFLLMQHADRWDLPKGHCEPGERRLETALRETQEETGIDTASIRILDGFEYSLQYTVRYTKPQPMQRLKQVTYFLGVTPSAFAVQCTEHLGYRWFDWQPPHHIQAMTIDPLLQQVEAYFVQRDCAAGARDPVNHRD